MYALKHSGSTWRLAVLTDVSERILGAIAQHEFFKNDVYERTTLPQHAVTWPPRPQSRPPGVQLTGRDPRRLVPKRSIC